MISKFLIRPSAWWFNKIPLSITTAFLLFEGKPFTPVSLFALTAIIATVSAVANFGYALNELFDQEEDFRAGRENAATTRTNGEMWAIISGSAISAVAIAILSGGSSAAITVGIVLLLPIAYSVPPARVKERGWLGIYADALAAHVFPAILAIIIINRLNPPLPSVPILAMLLFWAFAAGLRGILSHQLHSDTRDRSAGLTTVVYVYGQEQISQLVLSTILPFETIVFFGLIFSMPGLPITKVAAALFIVIEAIKFQKGRQPLYRFVTGWNGYIPFADEGFYKVWGPLALGMDLAVSEPLCILLLLFFIVIFADRIQTEWNGVRSLIKNEH